MCVYKIPCWPLQTRAGADKAKAELNGILLHDLELKIGWGKSIVIPPAPLYTAESVGISSAPLKPTRAAVPPPGVDAPAPWADTHSEDKVQPVGEATPVHLQLFVFCIAGVEAVSRPLVPDHVHTLSANEGRCILPHTGRISLSYCPD